jgi:PH (Pleckstrin Homology) domain-containing protein
VGDLTIRTAPRQLRGLRRFVVAVAAITALLILGSVLADGSVSGTLGLYAFVTGIVSVTGLWTYVMYARTVTECTPAGIRTRGLSGRTQCPWAHVTGIDLRPYRGTVTVMVTTTSGTRFRLGAPVSGGVMGDPEFRSKVEAIQDYWLAATHDPPIPR